MRAAFVSMGVGGGAEKEKGGRGGGVRDRLSECLMLLFIDYNFQVVDRISYYIIYMHVQM